MNKLPKLPKEWMKLFRQAGSKGGKQRKQNLTPERRKEIASAGGKARWAKKNKPGDSSAKRRG